MSYVLTLLLVSCAWVAAAQPTSIQERLGYPKNAKLLIIHADDLGVTNSETVASITAMEKGCVNSASIMVPCPWFPKMAAYAATHPQMDFGLHITLTSEWKYYKWGPITPAEQVPSLVNSRGFLYATVDSLVRQATPEAVEVETRNQVRRALQFGLQPTHLDAHMFAAFNRVDFLKAYLKIGHEFNIPVFVPRTLETSLQVKLDTIVSSKDVIVDYIVSMSPEDYKANPQHFYRSSLQAIQPGLTYFFIHTAFDDAEMQAVTEGFTEWGAKWRQQEYNFFTSSACQQLLQQNNIHLITWKEIRDKITRN